MLLILSSHITPLQQYRDHIANCRSPPMRARAVYMAFQMKIEKHNYIIFVPGDFNNSRRNRDVLIIHAHNNYNIIV